MTSSGGPAGPSLNVMFIHNLEGDTPMTKLGYKTLPPHAAYRGGCKVSFRYYKTEEEANAAAEIAKHNARIDRSLGYDFGYMCPGDVRLIEHDGELKGLYEVVVS